MFFSLASSEADFSSLFSMKKILETTRIIKNKVGKENDRNAKIAKLIKATGRHPFTANGRTFYPDPDHPDDPESWTSDNSIQRVITDLTGH